MTSLFPGGNQVNPAYRSQVQGQMACGFFPEADGPVGPDPTKKHRGVQIFRHFPQDIRRESVLEKPDLCKGPGGRIEAQEYSSFVGGGSFSSV